MSSHRAPASTSRLAPPRAVPDAGHPGEHRTIVLDDDWDDVDDSDFDDASYDDYPWDDEPQARVLWGRVAVLGGALLLAFLLGRFTAPGDAAALEDAEQRISELSSDLAQARAELDAALAGGADAGDGQAAAGDDVASVDQAADGAGTAEGGDAAGEAGQGAETADGQAATQESDDTAEAAGEGSDAGAAESPPEQAAAEQDAGEQAAEAEAEPPVMTTHTVEAGDNLFALAERFYGDGGQWRAIAEANDLPAGAVLAPGQELSIPAEQ